MALFPIGFHEDAYTILTNTEVKSLYGNYANKVGSDDEGVEKTRDFLRLLPDECRQLLCDETDIWFDELHESGKEPVEAEFLSIIEVLFEDREREVQKHFDYSTLPKE